MAFSVIIIFLFSLVEPTVEPAFVAPILHAPEKTITTRIQAKPATSTATEANHNFIISRGAQSTVVVSGLTGRQSPNINRSSRPTH